MTRRALAVIVRLFQRWVQGVGPRPVFMQESLRRGVGRQLAGVVLPTACAVCTPTRVSVENPWPCVEFSPEAVRGLVTHRARTERLCLSPLL